VKSEHGRQQDVDVAALDLLNGADVQIDQFREPLLRQFLSHPLSADVGPEGQTLWNFPTFSHAPVGRYASLTNTAQCAVK
jgi:hypothetical protein